MLYIFNLKVFTCIHRLKYYFEFVFNDSPLYLRLLHIIII